MKTNDLCFLASWYGRLEDIIEDLEEHGYSVDERNREYVVCYGEDEDSYYSIRLGGTESTITIESVEIIHHHF